MLQSLTVRNYALIRNLDLEFGPGLTIITGETGAGKSIMLGALSLIMGGRADTKMISDDGRKSVVEAHFVDIDTDLKQIFEDRGIDWTEGYDAKTELIIRREISSNGRSKVLVNGCGVTLQTLQLIVSRLIDIHSQHANAKINDPEERLRIIDSLADNLELRNNYRAVFNEYLEIRRNIRQRREDTAKAAENLEFMHFQLEQLDKLNPKAGELAEVERRFELLSDADEIKERLMHLCSILGNGENGVQSQLSEALSLAGKLKSAQEESHESASIASRLSDLLVEAKDVYETVEDFNNEIDTDPATLTRLSARMNAYYEALKRFRAKDDRELADLHSDLKAKVQSVVAGDDELPEMEAEARRLAHQLKSLADSLTESRVRTAEYFSGLICSTAAPLGLPNILFVAQVKNRKLSASGQDDIDFLCSFNKNGTPKPISEIASGGEIARMMLSLKYILAGHINLPTIIFDEVDTGVSGEIADKMGAMMHDAAENMQVIVITHLPQVAAKGDEHFKVYKTDGDTRTETHVSKLTTDERIREIAAMISGSEVSDAALSAARALLKSAK